MSWVIRSMLAALSLALVPVLSASCGGGSSSSSTGSMGTTSGSGSTSEGSGGNGGGGSTATYHTSACGMCVEQTRCLSQLNACGGDPSCAAYLDCLDACPLGPNGDADPTCEKACPAVSGSAGLAAQKAFINCRRTGLGATLCTACGQIPEPKDPDFHQMCPPPAKQMNKCKECEATYCCNTYQACQDSQDCLALVTCLKACMDDPCDDQCYKAHPVGYMQFGHRTACITHFCSDNTACGNSPLDPCVACVTAWCADPSAACDHDLQCTLLFDCEASCPTGDQACFKACETKFPTATTLLHAFQDCTLNHCENICGGTM